MPDPTPEEAARLLAAVRRAREDAAAGRVYRTSEAGLRAFLEEVGPRFGFPVVDEQGRALTPVGESDGLGEEARFQRALERALELGLIERA
ncbi:MAG TPA: hypothetical protein VHQ00_07760 [Chloroflexota bacterium]|nr:hypothetical protein [Chloroflexota bacterium]